MYICLIVKWFILFSCFWLNLTASAQTKLPVEINVTDKTVVPKHYLIPKTTAKLVIDGQAESAWDNAAFTEPFIDIAGIKTVKFETKVKLLWSDEFLYVYAELEEPHIWGNITKRDAIIYLNNDFEVFIDPSPKTEAYAEIELNALNTVWDLLLNKPYRVGGYANFHWNLDNMKTAVEVHGTLNNSSDIDQKWTVEMAIPMRGLIELKNDKYQLPKEGDQWHMNFSRVQWDHDTVDGKYRRKKVDGELQREYNWVWSNQKVINMHEPEKWGVVQFTETSSAKDVVYHKDPDSDIQQVAYALFREARWGELKGVLPKNTLESHSLRVTYNDTEQLDAELRKTSSGFEISLTSPVTRKNYSIDEMGKLSVVAKKKSPFTLATWVHGGNQFDKDVWTKKLSAYDSLDISEVLVGGSPEFIQQLVDLAKPKNIKIHAWLWTLNRPNDTIANKHPEWYAVNRKGKNSLEYRAYVDYYQWLSPFHQEARQYIKDNVKKLLAIDGLASIHLDYVRYVDVILGADLQPKYDLVQDHEMPEYDYGYHPIACEGFKQLFGKDPREMEYPELSTEWRQYRLNAVTSLVNEIADMVHLQNQKLTAAVFPFPEMSRQMVRQAWDDWNLDAAYPMIYHNFYRENINWIGFATEQGVNDVDFPVNTGLYMPGFESADDFEKAIRLAKEKGAAGVCLFTADNMKKEFKEVLIKLKGE